jgi:hypothetical protein
MWIEWDWTGWIKPQIDNAVALGANCVRLIGVIPDVCNGNLSQATYLARWQQFLDYTVSLGIYAYPCGGTIAFWSGVTLAQVQTMYTAWGPLMDSYANVIGIDVTNECFPAGAVDGQTVDQILTTVTALTATLRSVTSKPITNDRTAHSLPRWDYQEGAYIDALNDFHDIHSYYTQDPSDPHPWMNKWWGSKPILLGEIGCGLDLTSAQRTARYLAAKAMVDQNDSRFAGALSWAATDTNLSTQYGLFDPSFAARTDITVPFQTFSKARSHYPDTYTNGYN